MPSDQAYLTTPGYLTRFEIRKVFDHAGEGRFDVEIALARDWQGPSPTTTLRLTDVHDVRFGDPEDGTALGLVLCLRITDVSAAQWENVRYKVANIEPGFPLSIYCRAFSVDDAAGGHPGADDEQ